MRRTCSAIDPRFSAPVATWVRGVPLVGPGPVGNLRTIRTVLARVGQVVEDGVAHVFLQMPRFLAQLRYPVDDVDDQVEPRGLVQDGQLEGRVDVSPLLVAV